MASLKFALALLLALCIAPASAANVDDIRNQLHYSMVLTGSIDIDPTGVVTAHQLEQDASKLPPAVVQWVEQAVAGWRFAPHLVDGAPTMVRAPMRFRLVVEPVGTGETLRVRIVGAQFGSPPHEERVTFRKTPRKFSNAYPVEANGHVVPGTVYLAIRVGRDGKPLEVMAQQVNLAQVDEPEAFERRRKMLANAATRMAQGWTFAPPTQGHLADMPDWTVRVPVQFLKRGHREARPGEWEIYLPGPRQKVTWHEHKDAAAASIGAAASGDVDTLGAGLSLMTTLDGDP